MSEVDFYKREANFARTCLFFLVLLVIVSTINNREWTTVTVVAGFSVAEVQFHTAEYRAVSTRSLETTESRISREGSCVRARGRCSADDTDKRSST